MKKQLTYALVACSLSLFASPTIAMLGGLSNTQDQRRVRPVAAAAAAAEPSNAVALRASQDVQPFEFDDEDDDAAIALSENIDAALLHAMGSFVGRLDEPLDARGIRPVNPRLAKIYALQRELDEKVKQLDSLNQAFTAYINTRWPQVEVALDNLLSIGHRVRPSFLARMFQQRFPDVLFERDLDVFKVARRYDWLALRYTKITPKTSEDHELNSAISNYLQVSRDFSYTTPEGENMFFYQGLTNILEREIDTILSLRHTIQEALNIPGDADHSNREENIVERKLLRHAGRVAVRINTLYSMLSRSMRIQKNRLPRTMGLEDIRTLAFSVERSLRQMAPAPARRALPAPQAPTAPRALHAGSVDSASGSNAPAEVRTPYTVESPTPSVASSGASSPVDGGSVHGASAPSPSLLSEMASVTPAYLTLQIEPLRASAPRLVEAALALPADPLAYLESAGSKQRKNARNIAAALGNSALSDIVRPTPMSCAGAALKHLILQVMQTQSPADLSAAETLFTQPRTSASVASSSMSASNTGRPPVYPPAAPQ